MADIAIVWIAALFTSVIGIIAVVNAVHANKIKHGEITEGAKQNSEKQTQRALN